MIQYASNRLKCSIKLQTDSIYCSLYESVNRCRSAQQYSPELWDVGPGEESSFQSQKPDGPL